MKSSDTNWWHCTVNCWRMKNSCLLIDNMLLGPVKRGSREHNDEDDYCCCGNDYNNYTFICSERYQTYNCTNRGSCCGVWACDCGQTGPDWCILVHCRGRVAAGVQSQTDRTAKPTLELDEFAADHYPDHDDDCDDSSDEPDERTADRILSQPLAIRHVGRVLLGFPCTPQTHHRVSFIINSRRSCWEHWGSYLSPVVQNKHIEKSTFLWSVKFVRR